MYLSPGLINSLLQFTSRVIAEPSLRTIQNHISLVLNLIRLLGRWTRYSMVTSCDEVLKLMQQCCAQLQASTVSYILVRVLLTHLMFLDLSSKIVLSTSCIFESALGR